MDRIRQLFSFAGRASRLSFWRWLLLSSMLSAAFYVLAVFVAMAGFTGSSLIAAASLIAIVGLIWPGLAVSTRRLHDRGKAAWWLAIFYLLPYSAEAAAMQTTKAGGAWVLLGLLLVLVGLVVSVWGWVELGFLRGTRGPNRFGPEPPRR